VLEWVYDVLLRKASADLRFQTSKKTDTSVRYLNVEETFYSYLEDKYGSSHLANLAAKDILMYDLCESSGRDGGWERERKGVPMRGY
jgi:hypothetical protein